MEWLLTSNQEEPRGLVHYLWIVDIVFVDSSFSVTPAVRLLVPTEMKFRQPC